MTIKQLVNVYGTYYHVLIPNVEDGEIIFPSKIAKDMDVDISIAYKILFEISKTGIISERILMYTQCCHETDWKLIDVISKVPKHQTCPKCGRELNPFQDCTVVFQVKESEETCYTWIN